MFKNLGITFFIMLAGLSLLSHTALAQDMNGDKIHKVVIQVSKPDPAEHKIALNMAVNLQKYYGMDNIEIEIVAFGRGLKLLTPKSEEAARVRSLVAQNVTFSACQNTMDKIKRTTGKEPKLTEGVGVVRAGVARIIELQEQGYSYTAP